MRNHSRDLEYLAFLRTHNSVTLPEKSCGKMSHIIWIEFYKSRSKKYDRAITISALLSMYSTESDHIICTVDTVFDFIKCQSEIIELIQIVTKWKNSKIMLFEKEYRSSFDLYDFYDKLRISAGKYSVMLHSHGADVALGHITYEHLPKPIVYYPNHYGAFFAFSDDIGSPICFCECERKAIENYVRLRYQMPLTNYTGDKIYPLGGDFFPPIVANMSNEFHGNPLMQFRFESNLCFRCNKAIPKLKFCHPMYGGQFKQHFGWYIKQEYFRLGIDPYQIYKANVLPDECTPELYDSIIRISQSGLGDNSISRIIENSVREQLGYRKVGEAWVSETMMFHIVETIYPGKQILRHYRPKWLCGLELDVYVPDDLIGFEYQGMQHFVAVEHWGGHEQLEKQQAHDKRKKELCLEQGITLICVNYDEVLSKELIESKIAGSR
ncbi:MAG: hypothetical protein IKH77_03000 [Clostridia bacterium]|nr:hypothetical protein [Clostridia bacterium]